MKTVIIKNSKTTIIVNKVEKMRTDSIQRCIFGRVHTKSEDASSD